VSTSNNIKTRGKRRHLDKAVPTKKSGRQPRSLARVLRACPCRLPASQIPRQRSSIPRQAAILNTQIASASHPPSWVVLRIPFCVVCFQNYRTYWTCYHHHHHHHHHHYSSSLDSLLKFPSGFVSLNKVLVELLCVCVCVCFLILLCCRNF
jgi:hypothetical protein